MASPEPLRLVILGGSGASTPELIEALTTGPERGSWPPLEIVLVGRSRTKLEVVTAACRERARRSGSSGISVDWSTERREALRDAAVILVQVRIGGLQARAFDETFPRVHGLPGEETMGPGGFANALRTLPQLAETWRDISDRAPEALVIDLTNPAGIVTAAARRAGAPGIVSVCDSPLTLTLTIADRLGRPVDEVRRRYVGLNHLGWYVPESDEELERLSDLGSLDPEITRMVGAVGNPYARYYLTPGRILEEQLGHEARAEALLRLESEQLDGYRRGTPEVRRRGAVWYGRAVLPLLHGWLFGTDRVGIAGFPNEGRVRGLAPGVTVELPYVMVRPGQFEILQPVALPVVPARLLAQAAEYELETVRVAQGDDEDRRGRLRALTLNPMVRDVDLAARLLDTIEAGPSL